MSAAKNKQAPDMELVPYVDQALSEDVGIRLDQLNNKDDLSLYPFQEIQTERLLEMLSYNNAALDTSPPGSGKTRVALEVFFRGGFKRLRVIGKSQLMENWQNTLARMGIPGEGWPADTYAFYTLSGLSTGGGSNFVKPMLYDYGTNWLIKEEFFILNSEIVNSAFDESRPILYVLDESQNAKNKITKRFKTILGLTSAACHPMLYGRQATRNRLLLLSGTPFDKAEHSYNYFSLLGMSFLPTMCHNEGKGINTKHHPYGFAMAIQSFNVFRQRLMAHPSYERVKRELLMKGTEKENLYFNAPFEAIVEKVLPGFLAGDYSRFSDKKASNFLYDIYNHFCRHFLSISTPKILSPADVKVYRTNFFLDLNPEEANALAAASARYDAIVGVTGGKNVLEAYQQFHMESSRIKSIPAARIADGILRSTKRDKIIFFVNNNTTEEIISDYLRGQGHRVALYNGDRKGVTGDAKTAELNEMVRLFQEASVTLRVIIVKLVMGSEGINLNDIHGGYRRHSFLFPDTNTIAVTQAVGRIDRVNTRSSNCTYILYAGSCVTCQGPERYNFGVFGEFNKVYKNISQKSDIVAVTSDKESSHFPGKFLATFEAVQTKLAGIPPYWWSLVESAKIDQENLTFDDPARILTVDAMINRSPSFINKDNYLEYALKDPQIHIPPFREIRQVNPFAQLQVYPPQQQMQYLPQQMQQMQLPTSPQQQMQQMQQFPPQQQMQQFPPQQQMQQQQYLPTSPQQQMQQFPPQQQMQQYPPQQQMQQYPPQQQMQQQQYLPTSPQQQYLPTSPQQQMQQFPPQQYYQ